jgi:hypothetical protein
MAKYIGKDQSIIKILPVMIDLLKDPNSEVRLKSVEATNFVAKEIQT